MSAVAVVNPSPRSHVALVDLDAELSEFLRVCLFQIGINTLALSGTHDLARKKYEGCIVDLRNDFAEAALQAIRGSERNRRVVLFGVYAADTDLRKFSKYGINALLLWPARRADAIKVFRSAQTLLVHELRRYARIPLAAEIEVTAHNNKWYGISREVSGGGMSITFSQLPRLALSEYLEVSFTIPPGHTISLKGVVCWLREPEKLVGVQFMQDCESIKPVRAWIDDYLGIA